MDTQEILEESVKLAEKINKGEKAFTESLILKNYMLKWYNAHKIQIEAESGDNGFYLWNQRKIK